MLTTHNRLLEAQIAQKAALSSVTPDRLPSKPELNTHEHCNYVTIKEDEKYLTDSEEVQKEEGGGITVAGSKDNNYGGKTLSLIHI